MSFLISPYSNGPNPSYAYNTRSVDPTNLTIYTFTGLGIGTATSNRFVIIGTVGRGIALGSPTVSSLTIGGNAATLLAASPLSNAFSAFYGLVVPSGTTANVVVTLSSACVNCAVVSYSIYDLGSITPISVTNSAANPLALSANTLINSIVIGIGCQAGNTATTFNWTGVTERFDEPVEVTSLSWSGADDKMILTETPRAISAAFSAAPTSFQDGCLIVMR